MFIDQFIEVLNFHDRYNIPEIEQNTPFLPSCAHESDPHICYSVTIL